MLKRLRSRAKFSLDSASLSSSQINRKRHNAFVYQSMEGNNDETILGNQVDHSTRCMSFIDAKNGKIAEEWVESDGLMTVQQLGFTVTPPTEMKK